MPQIISGQVGPALLGDGVSTQPMRQGKLGESIISELHGRFYEQVYRGNVFSNGVSLTALSANTITLNATTTPILGVYNPSTSTVNVVILQASLVCYVNTFTTPVGAGSFVWASSIGNAAVSTGTAGFNRRTLASAGAQAKGLSFVALTGLSNNLVIFEAGDFSSPTGQTYGTIVAPTAGTSLSSVGGVQNFDGQLIVPPGGVLALLNTTSTTTMSAAGRLMWEEVPI